jgi:hypothetical protein
VLDYKIQNVLKIEVTKARVLLSNLSSGVGIQLDIHKSIIYIGRTTTHFASIYLDSKAAIVIGHYSEEHCQNAKLCYH